MITRDNFQDVIYSIDKENIVNAINEPGDYILLEVHIFNAGSYATIESMDYSDEVDQESYNNGQMFCDKDNFIGILSDAGININ